MKYSVRLTASVNRHWWITTVFWIQHRKYKINSIRIVLSTYYEFVAGWFPKIGPIGTTKRMGTRKSCGDLIVMKKSFKHQKTPFKDVSKLYLKTHYRVKLIYCGPSIIVNKSWKSWIPSLLYMRRIHNSRYFKRLVQNQGSMDIVDHEKTLAGVFSQKLMPTFFDVIIMVIKLAFKNFRIKR